MPGSMPFMSHIIQADVGRSGVGVVTLHRFELLQRPEKFAEVLTALQRQSQKLPLVYLAGGPERPERRAGAIHGLAVRRTTTSSEGTQTRAVCRSSSNSYCTNT